METENVVQLSGNSGVVSAASVSMEEKTDAVLLFGNSSVMSAASVSMEEKDAALPSGNGCVMCALRESMDEQTLSEARERYKAALLKVDAQESGHCWWKWAAIAAAVSGGVVLVCVLRRKT